MSRLWFRIRWAYYGFRYTPLDTSSSITLSRLLMEVKLKRLEQGIRDGRGRLAGIMDKTFTLDLTIPRDTYANASLDEQRKR